MNNTFGIEYEVNGINVNTAARALNSVGIDCVTPGYTHDVMTQYKAVPDGTVSAEVVSPILTPDRINETNTITTALKAAGARVNGTNTGLHIHLGIREWGMDDSARYNFVMNYYGLHHITGALVAPSRLSNGMCRTLNRGGAEAQANLAADFEAYTATRYLSLNTQSIDRYGTFEVRIHQGSLNPKKINAWLGYLAGLILIAKDGVDISDITPIWVDKRADKAAAKLFLNYMTNEGYLEPRNSDYLKARVDSIRP